MRSLEFEGLAVLVPESLEVSTLITPRASEKEGNFTFSNTELKLKALKVAVLSCHNKVLDIPPHFNNTEFTIIRCVVLSDEFLEEYGGLATELCELRFVGKSKDVFSRAIGKLVRSKVMEAMRANKVYDKASLFPFVLNCEMISEINKNKQRYYSVSSDISPIGPLDKEYSIDWDYLAHYVKSLEVQQAEKSLEPSS